MGKKPRNDPGSTKKLRFHQKLTDLPLSQKFVFAISSKSVQNFLRYFTLELKKIIRSA